MDKRKDGKELLAVKRIWDEGQFEGLSFEEIFAKISKWPEEKKDSLLYNLVQLKHAEISKEREK